MAVAGRPRAAIACAQRGVMLVPLLVTAAMLAALAALLLYEISTAARRGSTVNALGEARLALLGYAASYPDRVNPNYGPGYLPCPARDRRGIAGLACAARAGTMLGRLPWHTLRTNDLRDASGAQLWYALATSHRNNPKHEPMNDETPSTLALDEQSAVALIFAPGAALAQQTRRTIREHDAQEFLEITPVAGHSGHFARAASGNDHILALRASDLSAAVVPRVLGEIAGALRRYAQTYAGQYPWLRGVGGAPGAAFDDSLRVRRGMLAVHALSAAQAPLLTRYRTPVALSWAIEPLRIKAASGAPGLLPSDCLVRAPCAGGDSLTGTAECEWWRPARENRPPRDFARCAVSATQQLATLRVDYAIRFAMAADAAAAIVPPTEAHPRRRTLHTARPASLSGDGALFLHLSLAVTAADGRQQLLELTPARNSRGFFRVAGLRYDLDVDAGELPAWVTRNRWHARVFFAYARCSAADDCVALRVKRSDGGVSDTRVRALLLAAGAAAARSPAEHPVAWLTPANRSALEDAALPFEKVAGLLAQRDRVRIVERAP